MVWILAFLVVALLVDQAWTYFRVSEPRLYRPSPWLGWTLTPSLRRRIELKRGEELIWENDLSINRHGFNDHEWESKKSSARRVLVIGDSIIEARQVLREKNFVSLAEQDLNSSPKNSYELLNMGVAGWSVDSALNYFQEKGRTLQADVLILGLFVGNDLVEGDYDSFRYLFNYAWDCRRYDKPAYSLSEGRLVRSNFPAWKNLSARFFSDMLYRKSRSFRWIYQKWNREMSKRFNGSQLLRQQGISYNQFMANGKGNDFYYEQTQAQVEALAMACHQQGIQFGVMLEPNFPLFYPPKETDPTSKLFQEYQRDLGHYNEMFRRLSLKYPVLGLLPLLQASAEPVSFGSADPHLNPAGHRLVSQALSQFIQTYFSGVQHGV